MSEKITVLRCPDCEMIFNEEPDNNEPEPVYECNSCGEAFSRSNSYTGYNHQCPSCAKMASKVSDQGCPDCGVELEEVDMWWDESNAEWFEEES